MLREQRWEKRKYISKERSHEAVQSACFFWKKKYHVISTDNDVWMCLNCRRYNGLKDVKKKNYQNTPEKKRRKEIKEKKRKEKGRKWKSRKKGKGKRTPIYIYIYIYIYIPKLKRIYIYIYIYIYANFIEHNRHFMPTYSLLDPFEFPYYFYRIRGGIDLGIVHSCMYP